MQKEPNIASTIYSLSRYQRERLHISIIVEDLRLPLDEGAKKAAYLIIRSLMGLGVEASIFTLYKNPVLENIFLLPDNKFLWGSSFSRDLRTIAPDIIFYIPSSSGTMGAFMRAAMIKIQSHGVPLAMLSLQYRRLPNIAHLFSIHRYADIVFTQSKASNDIFSSYGCKTRLLPAGVDQTIFHPVDLNEKCSLRSKYGYKGADQIVLHVGHCNKNRNVLPLAQLAQQGFRVILIASSSTPIDHDLLCELRHSGVIVVTDFIENIHHYYQMADCYLFPLTQRNSAIDAPLSILEAMSCNLPIVTTRFGALPNMFYPDEGVYFIDNEEEIISKVILALRLQKCRTSELVIQYSWDNIAKAIIHTFQEYNIL